MLPATGERDDYRYHVVQLNANSRQDSKKQVAAVLSLVCLGLCAAVFVASAAGGDSTEEDSVMFAAPQIDLLEKAGRKTKLGALGGSGMEKDLNNDIATAFATFSKSSNETVKAMTTEFDPKAEEEKVLTYITQMKDLYGETAQEAKILKEFAKPEKPKH